MQAAYTHQTLNVEQYRPPILLRQPDLHTILPSLFRSVQRPRYTRERIETPDHDFIDLDWATNAARSSDENARLAIISHGLEGSSQSRYALGMTAALLRRGYDVLSWNFRGCSGEPNRKLASYHSGFTQDLHTVIAHALSRAIYEQIALVGFSVGGNITLKYLGEDPARVPTAIQAAVCLSTPCDLEGSSIEMAKRRNIIYMRWFLHLLRRKIRQKMALYPGQIDDRGFHEIRNFYDYDNRYTAPHFGYRSATEYWRTNSAKQFLTSIRVPTLLLSAADDSFLGPRNYPYEEARTNKLLTLEVPRYGGHVGFVARERGPEYWSETRTAQFLNSVLKTS